MTKLLCHANIQQDMAGGGGLFFKILTPLRPEMLCLLNN